MLKPVSRRYHLHYPGLLYAGVTVLIGFGAVNSQNNLLYIAFGLALAGLVVSGVVSGWMLLGLRARRSVLGPGAVGEPLVIRYEVSNRNRVLPAFALSIAELNESRRGATWRRHMAPAHAFVVHAGARGAVVADAVARPERRGEAVFTAFRVSSAFPFGIIRKSVTFRQRSTALIRPEAAPVGAGLLRRAATAADLGATARARVGRGMDYLGVREYAPGDSPRQIAWRATARTGQLIVRENMEPAAARVWIVLDLDPGAEENGAPARARNGAPARPDANERAISLCAGLATRAAAEGIDAGLLVPAVGVRRAPTASFGATESGSMRRAAPILDELARLDLSKRRPGAGATPELGRAAMIVVHASTGREGCAPWARAATHLTPAPLDAVVAGDAGALGPRGRGKVGDA